MPGATAAVAEEIAELRVEVDIVPAEQDAGVASRHRDDAVVLGDQAHEPQIACPQEAATIPAAMST